MDRRTSEVGASDRGATALRDARETIRSLADADGEFAVACRETGVRPDPVTDASFATYEAADRARAAAERYRAAMRRLDPDLAAYDLAVCETGTGSVESTTVRETTAERRANGLPKARQTVTLAGGRRDEWLRIENGAVVHLTGPDSLLDDEVVARQLASKVSSR